MEQKIWMSFLGIAFGWLLGLLTPIITSKYQERKKAKSLKKSILCEIDELRITMAQVIYLVESKFDGINYELIDYILAIYAKSNAKSEYEHLEIQLKNIRKKSENELLIVKKIKENEEFSKSLSMKKYYLPYLEAKINELSSLEDEFQRKSLELLRLLALFNDNVEEGKFFYKLTFDGNLSEGNHQIAQQVLNENHQFLARQARKIVEKINSFYDEIKSKS